VGGGEGEASLDAGGARRDMMRAVARWVAKRLLAYAEEPKEAVDETEALPVPPQSPLTEASLAMMYTPPVRATKPEPAPLAGSARARVEQARKRNA